MSEEQKRILQQQLWNIANTLRGKMNADEFRDYILGFIFYKYLSEKMHLYANDLMSEDAIDYTALDENKADEAEMIAEIAGEAVKKLGFTLKPAELFSSVAQRGQVDEDGDAAVDHFILDDLGRILRNIERSTMGTDSEDDFNQLFEDLDLTSSKLGKTEAQKNALVVRVLSHLDAIDFRLGETDADVLGDAYEYLIGEFASGAGKKAGEFYTPQTVSTILAQLVTADKTILKSVYDPTCGSGSLLLRVAKEVKEVAHFYGQELNRTTYNLARMNMILHDVNYRRFDIAQEDSLEHPQHIDERFEAIVANPPFSAHWSANPLFLTDDRFSQYGKLAPKTKADFAFVLHMVHHLADNGNMAVVLPHGVLFRGAAEGHIRKHLIAERNILDAVIGLPANIFYGTSIPTCILVFKKCRTRPDKVLFIDASQGFAKEKNQNVLLPEHIAKIIGTYQHWISYDKYSAVVPISEIRENDYNLNIPRYVDTFEEEEPVDLAAVADALEIIEESTIKTDKLINEYCELLGLPKPSGHNIYLLKQYKKGVMQQLFSQKLRFKNDEGGDYPDWEEKRLGDVAQFSKGKGISKSELTLLGDTECILYGELYTTYSEVITTVKSKMQSQKGLIFSKANDVIIPASGETALDIATVSCVQRSGIALGGDLNIIRSEINGIFLSYYLSGYMKNSLARLAQGSSVIHLYSTHLCTLNIEIPCSIEQQKIANFLSAIDDKITQTTQQLEQAQHFKKGLLQQMFV